MSVVVESGGKKLSGWRRRRGRGWASGAALLEVVLSLGLLAGAMMVIGAQVSWGVRMAGLARERTQALLLAESVLAQIDAGTLELEQELIGDFGPAHPGYAWRVQTEASPIEGMTLITISVLSGPPAEQGQEPDLESYREVYTCRTLRAESVPLNLIKDFGMSPEDAERIADAVPADVGLDPTSIDPASIAQFDVQMLMEVLPALMEAFGGGFNQSILQQLRGQQDQMGGLAGPAEQEPLPEEPQMGAGEPVGIPLSASGMRIGPGGGNPARRGGGRAGR